MGSLGFGFGKRHFWVNCGPGTVLGSKHSSPQLIPGVGTLTLGVRLCHQMSITCHLFWAVNWRTFPLRTPSRPSSVSIPWIFPMIHPTASVALWGRGNGTHFDCNRTEVCNNAETRGAELHCSLSNHWLSWPHALENPGVPTRYSRLLADGGGWGRTSITRPIIPLSIALLPEGPLSND